MTEMHKINIHLLSLHTNLLEMARINHLVQCKRLLRKKSSYLWEINRSLQIPKTQVNRQRNRLWLETVGPKQVDRRGNKEARNRVARVMVRMQVKPQVNPLNKSWEISLVNQATPQFQEPNLKPTTQQQLPASMHKETPFLRASFPPASIQSPDRKHLSPRQLISDKVQQPTNQ